MKQLRVIFVCFTLLIVSPAAKADFISLSLWDIFKSMLTYETDERTPLEKAIDLPEDTPQALEKKLARIDKLLTRKPAYRELSLSLIRASYDSSAVIVRRLLVAGADVNARTGDERSALMRSSANPDPLVVLLLLDAGADPNFTVEPSAGSDGYSVLIIAAEAGKPDMVKLLLERGATVNYNCNGRRETALSSAIIRHGENVTRLHFGSTEEDEHALDERYAAVVRVLLDHGADANLVKVKSSFPATPLVLALSEDGSAFVPMLLDHGAKVNAHSSGDWPLTTAAYHGDAASLKLLLARGADVRAVDSRGRNALVAAFDGLAHLDVKLDLVKQLLAAGAPVNAKNGGLPTTLIEAMDGINHTSIDYRIKPSERFREREREIEILLRLIELGADLDTVDKHGATALSRARENKYLPVVEAIERRMTAAERSRIED